ncbi:catechol 2,3-dioxygenase-like lactoylglutathione lyase family enzyme [Brevibacterium sanguinis]|uniref:Catechol 2,3-dioxygenase-like lactoylglutathione lyase family enzyme n=2 Tax=Brevibacterium TaxID=1696 RepID=A0A366IPB3_9MICO|nr:MULTISPECIES: VOC family protein [Brevibacterium]RBP67224.1 catechol 2,3-dioxygenase-like lactoylglutathione lyase family enzyme [Brevibacterium sanguinis]RBP73749.1 catechol 2,3-dioxygenase-like lactoylglutathione lyase family enzyme [Brevibacterium celere]
MRAQWISIPVDDQARALEFYTEKLGFLPKFDIPVGDARWLTVVSPENPDGAEIVLEPKGHPAAAAYTEALAADGIPINQFAVDDVEAEYERLSGLGVTFTQKPTQMGPITTAVLDDTVGNLVQIIHQQE